MAYYLHDPALLSHADGFALTNGATTDAAAGTVLTCALSTGGSVTHRTSPTRSWECVGAAGVGRLDMPVTAAAMLGVEILFDIVALPTGANNRLIEIRHATNYAMKIEMNTSGQLIVLNAANASVYTSAALGTGEVRLFAAVGKGTGATDGDLELRIYSTNPRTSTTPDQTPYSVANGNAGTADLVVARAGRVSSTAGSTADVKILNWQAVDSLTPPGPLVSGVTASPTGIASSLAFGVVAVALALSVSPAGIASAEAIGTPVASTTLTASPAGIGTGETFGVPAATVSITASPAGIGSGETFGSPTVSTSLAAAPAGIATSEAFGAVTVMATGSASPVGIPSAETFGVPTVTGVLAVSPTGIVSGEAFGVPTFVDTSGYRDITVTGTLGARRWVGTLVARDLEATLSDRAKTATLPDRTTTGTLDPRRWEGALT